MATGIAICKQRDPKGHYKRALAGEIPEFTGVSAPYEIPLNPDATIFPYDNEYVAMGKVFIKEKK